MAPGIIFSEIESYSRNQVHMFRLSQNQVHTETATSKKRTPRAAFLVKKEHTHEACGLQKCELCCCHGVMRRHGLHSDLQTVNRRHVFRHATKSTTVLVYAPNLGLTSFSF